MLLLFAFALTQESQGVRAHAPDLGLTHGDLYIADCAL